MTCQLTLLENIVGSKENAGYQEGLLFQECFQVSFSFQNIFKTSLSQGH